MISQNIRTLWYLLLCLKINKEKESRIDLNGDTFYLMSIILLFLAFNWDEFDGVSFCVNSILRNSLFLIFHLYTAIQTRFRVLNSIFLSLPLDLVTPICFSFPGLNVQFFSLIRGISAIVKI